MVMKPFTKRHVDIISCDQTQIRAAFSVKAIASGSYCISPVIHVMTMRYSIKADSEMRFLFFYYMNNGD